jgi:alpha-tubulin suppressor-like RCC1 family protein
MGIAGAATGCGGRPGSEVTGWTESALVSADILGFETTAGWQVTTGTSVTLSQSTQHVQGNFSLGVRSPNGFAEIKSNQLSSTAVASIVSPVGFDLMLPTTQVNPSYFGAAQLYYDIPSKNVFNAFIGQVELTGRPTGVFQRVEFALSASQLTTLRSSYTDLDFKIALNLPTGETGTYLLDRFGTLTAPKRVAVATGFQMSCGLTATSGVECWGGFGENATLGNGTAQGSSSLVPVQVTGLTSGVAAVAVGGGHACALTNARTVWCWGDNIWGELADGTTNSALVPVQATKLGANVAQVVTGHNITCGLTFDGAVNCAGLNGFGELGNGTTSSTVPPIASFATPVVGLGNGSGVVAIAALGEGGCALTSAGAVSCWGENFAGQLGNGTGGTGMGNEFSTVPVSVQGLGSGVTAIAAGNAHACALTSAGTVLCWGGHYTTCGEEQRFGTSNNDPTAPICGGIVANTLVPVAVSGLPSGILGLSVSSSEASQQCAFTTSAIWCWGNDGNGQLGNGATTSSTTPVHVSTLGTGVTAVSGGEAETCANASGHDFCWGYNGLGQLGNGTTTDSSVPVQVSGL